MLEEEELDYLEEILRDVQVGEKTNAFADCIAAFGKRLKSEKRDHRSAVTGRRIW